MAGADTRPVVSSKRRSFGGGEGRAVSARKEAERKAELRDPRHAVQSKVTPPRGQALRREAPTRRLPEGQSFTIRREAGRRSRPPNLSQPQLAVVDRDRRLGERRIDRGRAQAVDVDRVD